MKLSSAILSLIFVCAPIQPAVCAGQGEEPSAPVTAQSAAPVTPAASVTPAAPTEPAPPIAPVPPVERDASKTGAEPPAAVKSAASAGDSKRYVIGPLDVLVIKVWNEPRLSGAVDVNTDGMITVALIGEVKADGLTTQQLRDTITQRLHQFFVNIPEVTVEVGKVNSKRYFVYGGVGRPGEFPLIEKTTIMDALSLVGGFKEFAKQNKIRIQRGTQTFYFNYKDFSRGRNMDKNVNIELQSGDRIYVPE